MTTEEIAAAREIAMEFLQMLATEKWSVTGLDPQFLAEAMVTNGAGMLHALGRGAETAERLRDLADELESGKFGHA